MTSFKIIQNILQTLGYESYEQNFLNMQFDDNTVLKCISDPCLQEQLKLMIPNVVHFIHFISKFKELKGLNKHVQVCIPPVENFINTEENVIPAFKNISQGGRTDSGGLNLIEIPDNKSIIIPTPPPLPSPDFTSTLKNSGPVVLPATFLEELKQKRLASSTVIADQDEGYSEDSGIPITRGIENGIPLGLLDEMKKRISENLSNGEEIAKRTEENRFKNKRLVELEMNAELAKVFQTQQSKNSIVDIDTHFHLNKKNVNLGGDDPLLDMNNILNNTKPTKQRKCKSEIQPVNEQIIFEQNELKSRLARRASINSGEIKPEVRVRRRNIPTNDDLSDRNTESMSEKHFSKQLSRNQRTPQCNTVNKIKVHETTELENKLKRRISINEGKIVPREEVQCSKEAVVLGDCPSELLNSSVCMTTKVVSSQKPNPPIKPRNKVAQPPLPRPRISEKPQCEESILEISGIKLDEQNKNSESENMVKLQSSSLDLVIVEATDLPVENINKNVSKTLIPSPPPLPSQAFIQKNKNNYCSDKLFDEIKRGVQLKKTILKESQTPELEEVENKFPLQISMQESLFASIISRRDAFSDSESECEFSKDEELGWE